MAFYFICGALPLFVPATVGSMWPIYTPLAIIPLIYLTIEEQRSRRIIGALLVAAAITIIILDLRAGRRLQGQIHKVQIEALKNRAEQAVPGYDAQGASSPEP